MGDLNAELSDIHQLTRQMHNGKLFDVASLGDIEHTGKAEHTVSWAIPYY